MARVQVLRETTIPKPTAWTLWFQWCRYIHDDGRLQHGYRFIWKRPEGSLQAARGQARIPSVEQLEQLVALAKAAGWGGFKSSDFDPEDESE